HCGGNFPFWLSPIQARVMSISDEHVAWCREIADSLRLAGYRVDEDHTNAKTGAKIRDARLARVPYVLVVGGREVESRTVALRERPDKDLGAKSLDEIHHLFKELERTKA